MIPNVPQSALLILLETISRLSIPGERFIACMHQNLGHFQAMLAVVFYAAHSLMYVLGGVTKGIFTHELR